MSLKPRHFPGLQHTSNKYLSESLTDGLNEVLGDELHEQFLRPVVGADLRDAVVRVAGHVALDRVGRLRLVQALKKDSGFYILT